MSVPDEVREALIEAVVENIGPVFGNPEYLAKPGNVERLEARRRNAAASHVDTVLAALEAAGWVCVPDGETHRILAEMDNAYRQMEARGGDMSFCSGARCALEQFAQNYAAMLTASRPKEKDDV